MRIDRAVTAVPQRGPLRVVHNTDLDQLEAAPLDAVADRAGPRRWRPVSDRSAYLLNQPDGTEIGFVIQGFSTLEDDDERLAEMWGAPRFHAPLLGLREASAGEIAIAARTFFAGHGSLSQQLFALAVNGHGEPAIARWRACLECGDLKGHYGLGYTLLEQGRTHEAYRHLRYYAELLPADAWAQRYCGLAAERCGHRAEAADSYLRATLIESMAEPTDAAELLARNALAWHSDLLWIPDALPQLTDAQAFAVLKALEADGVDPGELRRALMGHLPAPGNGLRRERPRLRERDSAPERRGSLVYNGYPDPLLAAVEDFVFTLLQVDGGEHYDDVLLWTDTGGALHAQFSLDHAIADPETLGDELRSRHADRFAFLTRRLSTDPAEVIVLLGTPPARSDALAARVEIDGDTRCRHEWRTPDQPEPARWAGIIVRCSADRGRK